MATTSTTSTTRTSTTRTSTKAPKVYGMLVHAPRDWAVESAPNGGRQVRVIAAVPSMAAFQRLLDSHRLGVSLYTCREYASTTGNATEVEVATSQPGILFRSETTSHRRSETYVPAETPA